MIDQHYGGKAGFWKALMQWDEEKSLMGCNIKGVNGKQGPHVSMGMPTGLFLNHAYGLSDIMEIKNPDEPTKPF